MPIDSAWQTLPINSASKPCVEYDEFGWMGGLMGRPWMHRQGIGTGDGWVGGQHVDSLVDGQVSRDCKGVEGKPQLPQHAV